MVLSLNNEILNSVIQLKVISECIWKLLSGFIFSYCLRGYKHNFPSAPPLGFDINQNPFRLKLLISAISLEEQPLVGGISDTEANQKPG